MFKNKNFRWQRSIMKKLQKAIEIWIVFYFQNLYIFHDFFSRTYANRFTNILQIFVHVDRKIIMSRNMHFITRFYNKHHIDSTFSNVIESNERRIESNQHENRIAFNVDQYESNHEKDANEQTTRLEQQKTTRTERKKRANAYIIQNDENEKKISTQKKKTTTSTSSSEKSTSSNDEKKTQSTKAKKTNNWNVK
jgi:hypothetical protein